MTNVVSRLIRKTAILAALELTYGTDALPTGADNALAVSNLSMNPLNAEYIARDIIREYLGGSEELPGARYVECGFDVELVGSGLLAVPPAWGPLVRAIGFAEVITEDVRVDYVPVSGDFESATIYWHDDGVLHKLLGARGTATLDLGVGKKPVISFKFMAVDGGIAVVANPTTTLTAWRVPQTVIDGNSGELILGATHSSTLAPALVGGTEHPSEGLMIDLGVKAQFQKLLGGESISISDRDVTGSVKLKLSPANEVAFMAKVKSAAKTSFGMQHGTVANDKVMVFMPGVQMKEPTKEELNGERLIGYKLRVLPVTGNDEIRITTSFA